MADEKRLIDANALKERAIRVSTAKEHCYIKAVGTREIDKAPTIDAVPVVRCKDCVHMKNQFHARFCNVWCMYNGMGDDGFCNYGERRNNE